MDGLLIINKPEGWTSHDVVARVRRILKAKRVGHTGTLDPFATGVMVILVGRATRLAQFLDKDEKEYEALLRFGFETDTGDRTGARSVECIISDKEIRETLAQLEWESVLNNFRGEIEQTPPMYSAKKVDGKKLYELARKGLDIERKSNKITIHVLEVLDDLQFQNSTLRIRVVCSAGTYVRTLAEDIGRLVGVGAHLEELRRTRAGKLTIGQAIELENLEESDDSTAMLLPVQAAVADLRSVELADDRVEKTLKGMSTRIDQSDLVDHQPVQMVGPDGALIAIGHYDEIEKAVRPKVVLG